MREKGCFPLGVDAQETLEFFFMSNATMLDCEGLSVVAATLVITLPHRFPCGSIRNII
jgi:hypothetical protein